MYTLKGVFPEPKKEQKRNFIRENMKQLKYLQGKGSKTPKFTIKHSPMSIGQVKSSPSNRSGKATLTASKLNARCSRTKSPELQIRKGDMAEFLRRKELRQARPEPPAAEESDRSSGSSARLRDIACQTADAELAQKMADGAKLTVLYPKKDEEDLDAKLQASGDNARRSARSPRDDLLEPERRARVAAMLDKKDPYLPTGYQKGVLPKYLRERRGADDECPAGHAALPDAERRDTLRMLRNSFAELVSELNKMPVKTDTLRMRNRKMELEKQLAKLEEGIKVFSRPRVFVKMGE